MIQDGKILIGKNSKGEGQYLLPEMSNRHGLIAGATGTGKTTTLKVIAEGFSELGVPVFLADIKGDLTSMCQQGQPNDKLTARLTQLGITDFPYRSFPVDCWDVFGAGGHPLRATVSEMGPLLLSKLMQLNDTQRSVLSVVFKIADEQKMLLLDMKDLKSMLQYIGDNCQQFTTEYGFMTKQSIGAIQRSLSMLESQGGDQFFGEPAIDIWDILKTGMNGYGYINVLDSTKLFQSPDLYATMLLFILSELYERLPEMGDAPKPKVVFFFDEAHLLFDEKSKALQEKIEQLVRLARSKGVGIYFVSQSPMDIPGPVLAQLSNRVQHALRAYTPADQKLIKATCDTFRPNDEFAVEDVITNLATGEALISTLDDKGVPGIVERSMILPPESFMGAVDPGAKTQAIQQSMVNGKYEAAIDRESAYELLIKKYQDDAAAAEQAKEQLALEKQQEKDRIALEKQQEKERVAAEKDQERRRQQTLRMVDNVAKSTLREVTKGLTRNNPLLRGLLGGLTRR